MPRSEKPKGQGAWLFMIMYLVWLFPFIMLAGLGIALFIAILARG